MMPSVINRFNHIVSSYPLKTALVSEQETLTYRQLDHRASLVAQSLICQGLFGQLVCLHFDSSIELIVSILGVLKAGGTYVCLDRNYPNTRKQYIIDKSRASVLLTTDNLDVTVSKQLYYGHLLNEPLSHNLEVASNPIINVIFTSGSTGEPKGVKLSNDNMLSFVDTHNDITVSDCMPQFSSIAFDAFQFELWAMLLNGGTLCFLPEKTLIHATALQAAIAQHGITMAFVTTALVNLGVLNQFINQPTLRRVYFGGEKLKENAIKRDFLRFDFELVHCYGPSETTVWNVSQRIEQWSSSIPLGQPLENSSVLLVSDDGDQINDPGQLGEVYIGGPCVSQGYLHDDELTNASFVTIDDKRYFKTSDMASWNEEAQLVYSHRTGNTVKHNGYRINLNEVDRAIQSCDEVILSVTTLVEGDLTTFYCQSELDELEVRRCLAEVLPDYMRPTHIVKVEQFPITPHGKIDVQLLSHYRTEHMSNLEESEDREEVILSIWQKLLGNQAIDLNDRYFESGGNSVLLLKLQRELNSHFSINVKVSELFSHTTVAEQAELVGSLLEQ